MERILLGAYQVLETAPYSNDPPYGPKSLMIKLTTAVDEPFVNKTVTAILSAEDQMVIINAFKANLEAD